MSNYIIGIGVICLIISIAMQLDEKEKEKNKDYFTKIASCRYVRKINFEDHTYIHLLNTWSSVGDQLLHDPDCKCFHALKEKNTGK